MSGRRLVRQPDGRWTRGYRKTLRRLFRRAPAEMPDWRLAVLIPEPWALRAPGAGATGFVGVTVEPDPISGPLAVATGKNLEWVLTQMGKFLLSIAAGAERIISANLQREAETRGQQIVLTPGMAMFPISLRSTLKVTA